MNALSRLTALCAFTLFATTSVGAAAAGTTLALAPSSAAPQPESALVDSQACRMPFASYAEWIEFVRGLRSAHGESFDEAAFRAARPAAIFAQLQQGSIEC
ncbi:MAG: hypothetical protein JNJ60_07960, partial [Rhodocyclaceae bacterium]|nr:hypothetical protein [Rhodocyclaceae bacterium]